MRKALWYQIKHSAKSAFTGRRKRVSSVSKQRRKEMVEYRRLATVFLKENPKCCYCADLATEVHHFAGKIGRLLNYTPFFRPMCKDCHAWVHRNPEQAVKAGLMAGKGQWNRMPL